MATIKPFKAIRPNKYIVDKVAALPYDVMNSKEARRIAEGNPYSFLHIDKSEIDLDENIDLYDAIKCLKEDLRVITILFYFEDMSYKDIAVALNIAEGTVKSRLFRAKEALYEILKDNI